MIKRENIKKLEWHQESDFDSYDTVRYFIDKYEQFPNNTLLIGNNKKGFISYKLFRTELEKNGANILYSSESFNNGIRKLYMELDGTLFLLDSIYSRELKDFKDCPESLGNESDKFDILGSLTILHKEETLDKKYKEIINNCFLKPKNVHTVGMIARDQSGFFLNEVRLEVDKMSHELELHYGKGFQEFHNTLLQEISTIKKGLSLFHGKHGTGKSYYIKKLIFDITEKTNKKVILLPASMISYILEPDFNIFLLDIAESIEYDDDVNEFIDDITNTSKKNDGIVLLLEDAESVLQKRDTYNMNNQSTSNILNLTDGILNDIFGIQIIATYNTKDENIDPALKREMRLLAKREFKNLSLEESKALAEYLEIDTNLITKEMSVAEIYALIEKDKNDILIDKREAKKGNHLI